MQKIRIDFDNPGLPQHISVVENDSQSRFFQATLYENGKAYTAPAGASYSIMYRGFGPQNQGWYDTINDGAGKRAACTAAGNTVTCEIARQALQVPGHVSIVLCVTTGKGYMLKSWPIECNCKNDRYDSTTEIESFFYITQISNADWTQAIQAWENLKDAIDPTLSLSGKAADAKTTGDAVGQLNEDFANVTDLNFIRFSPIWESGDLIGDGIENNDNTMRRTGFLDRTRIKAILNGSSAIYAYIYDANKKFIAYLGSASTDKVYKLDDYGASYIRFATRPKNLDKLEMYSSYDLLDFIQCNGTKIDVNINKYYEKGSLAWDGSGAIGKYASGFEHSRTPKYLHVIGGVKIKLSYTVGKVYVFQYDRNKNFIDADTKYAAPNTLYTLTDDTCYVRIEHDNYVDEDVGMTYYSPDDDVVFSYGNRANGDTIAFGYEVYPAYKTDTEDTYLSYNTRKAYTSGLLMLPPNYTDEEEKVPLIYFSHGSADYSNINDTEFSASYMDYIRYLSDEGYAIFDCFGWTDLYQTAGAQMGNPTNMAAIRQGIEWVCRNYNVDINSVYVTGKSLGGLQAINMCYDFPIKACCPIAPEIDATSIGFGYDVTSRKNYARDLGFSEDTNSVLDEEGSKVLAAFSKEFKAYAKENAKKLLGYNPLWRNLIGVNAQELIQYQIDGEDGRFEQKGLPNKIAAMNRICNVPTKIICAIDDTAVSHDLCNAYLQSIKNCGGVAEMRSLPSGTGGHHAVDNAENAPKVARIMTKCGIVHANVPLAYAEMVQFFRRFS